MFRPTTMLLIVCCFVFIDNIYGELLPKDVKEALKEKTKEIRDKIKSELKKAIDENKANSAFDLQKSCIEAKGEYAQRIGSIKVTATAAKLGVRLYTNWQQTREFSMDQLNALIITAFEPFNDKWLADRIEEIGECLDSI